MSFFTGKVLPIVIAILFFELIIIVHEGGHFLAAKITGVKVNEFSIGMGPKIFSFKKGDTLYSMRWLLFGGYCAMEGEQEQSDDKNAFTSKSIPKRMLIIVAGAFNNLVLGFLIILIILCNQSTIGTTVVGEFAQGAKSEQSGLCLGDKIKSIDGMRTFTSTDVLTGLSRAQGDSVQMVVERGGKSKKLKVTFATSVYDGKKYINTDFGLAGEKKTFKSVMTDAGAVFVSFSRIVFLSVADLIRGRFSLGDLSGPVGAVSVVSSAAKAGVQSALRIMALLTINVGIFNLFPIPALDGWRFFTLLGEAIFRRKLPEKIEYAINAGGLALLLVLMVFITFSDISKLVS